MMVLVMGFRGCEKTRVQDLILCTDLDIVVAFELVRERNDGDQLG